MRKRAKQQLLNVCIAAAVVLSSTLTPLAVHAVQRSETRIGGVDQYETAALIAQKGWSGTVDNVVLSAGMTNNLVDALAAGPLSAKLMAPILLTDGGPSLNSFAKAELQRLKPKRVYLTSGVAVIKSSVIAEIIELGIIPVQLGGYDQYETSINIAQEMMKLGTKVTKVIVAAGWMAPVDALSVASIAATLEIPILATTREALPPIVKSFLDQQTSITDSYVIGGSAVVGAIEGVLPGTIHRYYGMTKYDTNLEILNGFADNVKYTTVYVASGDTFVDALSGVPLSALTKSPIVLSQNEWSSTMMNFLTLNQMQNIVALGGVVAVPDRALKQLIDISTSLPIPPVTPPVITPTPGPGSPTTPPATPSTVTLSNLQVITNPANSLGTFDNGDVIDLSELDNSVKFLGFSLTADQDCTLQFKVEDNTQIINLTAGQQRVITIGDLILGEEITGGVDLEMLRIYYQTIHNTKTKTLNGQLIKAGKTVGTLKVTLRFST